jgi:hypothetical protein
MQKNIEQAIAEKTATAQSVSPVFVPLSSSSLLLLLLVFGCWVEGVVLWASHA